jgi:hypothetical protein
MDRPSSGKGRRAGIVLIVVGVVLGLALAGVLALPGAAAPAKIAPAAARGVGTVGAVPDPAPAGPDSGAVTVATTFSTYTTVPFTLLFSLTVVNATISPATTSIWLNVTDITVSPATVCVSNNISGIVTAITPSPATFGTTSTAYYGLTVDSSYFANYSTACPSFLGDNGFLNITAVVLDPTNGTVVTSNALASATSAFILTTPSSLLEVSLAAGTTSTYTLSATYSAQYSGRVALSIYNPAGTAVIFSYNLAHNGTQVTYTNWTETTAGTYPYTLTLYTTYGGFNSSGSISVLAATRTYSNTTTWTNATLIPGLSAGASGTLLLVIGLIVGMIVALVVGRLVWGGSKAPGPAQPWSAEQQQAGKTGTAGTNTCSVCGQSFGTPEELAAHSKSEHGMS